MADGTGTTTNAETPTAVKPGYRTTEFWLATLATLVSLLYASGVIASGGTVDKALAFVVAALASLGYSVSRGLTKKAGS